ncbi:uncharacterized protein LOC128952960 [Oppia nitens]|uniref:uncharacterized protein LOC128952960 n=1 Tax=Oppia nitens TaxID=1686743 RepID=UPI0023DA9DB7|nr:uncharacterized protein LOC128952960 [Oppia nitens]
MNNLLFSKSLVITNLLFLCFLMSRASEQQLCEDIKENYQLIEAFHYKKDLIIEITKKPIQTNGDNNDGNIKFYIIKDFDTTPLESGGETKFSDVIDASTVWQTDVISQLSKMNILFWLGGPQFNTNDRNLIGINSANQDGIDMLKGWEFIPVTNVGTGNDSANHLSFTGPPNEININLYKHEPNKEKYGLMTLFAKFPQESLEKLIQAIIQLPSQPRLLIFYLELSAKPVSEGEPNSEFKLHVFEAKNKTYGDSKPELEWEHQKGDDKCFIYESVNASALLTDKYTESGGKSEFKFIQFSGNEFKIKKVIADNKQVYKDISEVTGGSIHKLFHCPELITTTTSTTKSSDKVPTGQTGGPHDGTTKEPKEKKSSSLWWIIIIIVIIIIIIIVLILCLAYCFVPCFRDRVKEWRYPENRRTQPGMPIRFIKKSNLQTNPSTQPTEQSSGKEPTTVRSDLDTTDTKS